MAEHDHATEERFKQEFWNGVAAGAGAFGVIWFLVANWADHTSLVLTSKWFYGGLAVYAVVSFFNAWRRRRRFAALGRYIQSLHPDRQ